MALMTGPLSPYVSPEALQAAPTGVSWNTLPDQRATDDQKYAAVVNLCQRATGMCDTRCGQVLRATLQTETAYGPDYRVHVSPNGNTTVRLGQWPILTITAIQVAPANVYPRQWTQVATGSWAVARPALLATGTSAAADSGTGGQEILIGPGYVDWSYGRAGYAIEVSYIAGWPHAGIAGTAAEGAETLQVDDCTGWAPLTPGGQGCTGVIHDVAGNQEAVTATASSAVSGPGVLTLAAPLAYSHNAGIVVSGLPDQVQQAAIFYAASLALARGATATTIQTTHGTGQATSSGHTSLKQDADALLGPFRRVI